MLKGYWGRLEESWRVRKEAKLPAISWIVVAVCGGVGLFIALALNVAPEGETPDYHFVNEEGAATALSAVLLASSCAFSLAAATALVRRKDQGVLIWAIISAVFGFLAFDELVGFHEAGGRAIETVSDPGVFRSWNDVVVLLYGVVAISLGVVLLPMVLRFPRVVEFFALGFFFYALHSAIDSMSEPRTVFSVICEESSKLVCGGFLALGAYTGLLGVLWRDDVGR